MIESLQQLYSIVRGKERKKFSLAYSTWIYDVDEKLFSLKRIPVVIVEARFQHRARHIGLNAIDVFNNKEKRWDTLG